MRCWCLTGTCKGLFGLELFGHGLLPLPEAVERLAPPRSDQEVIFFNLLELVAGGSAVVIIGFVVTVVLTLCVVQSRDLLRCLDN